MLRRYFQLGDEDADDSSSGEEEAEQAEQLPPPEEVWGKVRVTGCVPSGHARHACCCGCAATVWRRHVRGTH
jgi:hypothetical protein